MDLKDLSRQGLLDLLKDYEEYQKENDIDCSTPSQFLNDDYLCDNDKYELVKPIEIVIPDGTKEELETIKKAFDILTCPGTWL